ncbi:hypothetical protein SNOG_02012 [Parastagonospora nodorum SN15]|uniref:CNH domain-containing protein n=1 Tax=Phaeosphaeria nodorum (strain SN15 / ATCC MYA-4574 / FGSC 10173) TaxID=321614 RepID=Q0V1V2_PHANO|nr:hypothetical protein SNOG_02012 [Parastagonospora nodorum SN15]EAT90224.2 hypothetical protein SNOG_02012 [Parastagonospora nodorum SN15]
MAEAAPQSQLTPRPPPQDGPFILRKLVSDLPLSADGDAADVRITCVEVWNGNLYVGTSAAEIIHFVLLPPEPDDTSGEPTAIIASRLEPPHSDPNGPGVQQILILPKVNKACILCNNTFSIYSLPELSPESNFKPIACLWVGGVDLNEGQDDDADGGVDVVIGLKKRLRLVHISEHSPPRALKTIEYGGCLTSVRRDAYSCAADAHSYALLDVVHQQKIGLFPISSLDPDAGDVGGAAENIASIPQPPSRSVSNASPVPRVQEEQRGHARSTKQKVRERRGNDTVSMCQSRSRETCPRHLRDRQVEPLVEKQEKDRLVFLGVVLRLQKSRCLRPQKEKMCRKCKSKNLASRPPSPNPNEFLLTVGTTPSEPGVGMFVNLDGDMCRGSIQFSSYPDSIVVDGSGIDLAASTGPDVDAEEGYVIAAVHREEEEELMYGVEIQRWDVDPSDAESNKEWLDLSGTGLLTQETGTHVATPLGMRTVVEPYDLILSEIGAKLSVKRLQLGTVANPEEATKATTAAQVKADREFTDRLSRLQTRNLLWADDQIWWTVRNPLVLRLDARLEKAQFTATGDGTRIQPDRRQLEKVLGDIRGQEPQNESEYLSLIYIRQKASVMLFMDVILRTKTNIIIFENEKRITEQALIEGEVDPRVVLSLLPILQKEVVQGPEGIQISGGITTLVEQFLQQNDLAAMPTDINGPFGDNLLHFLKRYLQFWKRQKGMASVTNDPNVFRSVDAALLHILLLLDQGSAKGSSSPGTHRAELNELVDKEVDCFERAVELLEQFKRLYLLSRFYQGNCKSSEKAPNVLATWKRILDGEEDKGGEFVDGERTLRTYLSRLRDKSLVEEYGAWLANRNPKLGVQIFADDQSKVKFEPSQAVALLREKAPGAVKEYLEYLVFGKKHTQYVNELIAFYLDTVITELESNSEARAMLAQTYETYRILVPPKPTYHSFITDNAIPAEWWQARLRLLQLLGSNQPATSSYDVSSILSRLQPFEQELVPEMIILNGRQERHQEALRLLVHGLGDFDTSISYCLYGYSSIFRPITAGHLPIPASELPSRAEQSRLFNFLLQDFLQIEDLSQRVERTSELLERFAGWFDIGDVLALLPSDWSVDVFSAYLINSLRTLVREKAESGIVRALSDAQNSQASCEVVVQREKIGATFERGE